MRLRQIALDTETTGLEPTKGHRIIEIGCVEMINRKLTGNNFHIYINPDREIDSGAIKVHGITNAFLRDKPVFANIANELKDYIDGAQLIIHNAAFDIGFLNHEFLLANKKAATVDRFCSIVDTLMMARKMHPGQKNSLDALCKRYSIDNSHRQLHGALVDAHLLARLYLAMTGGQTQLFGGQQQADSQHSADEAAMTKNQLIQNQRKFNIITASPEELALHTQRVKQLAAKNKKLWEVVV
ncbi:MAG: DNA polymerase III subunit epsilon [Gammaproteobacteria bacterium]